jgi:hypothetical protein
LVLVLGLVLFWPQVHALASEVVTRTQKGSSLQLASFLSLGELPEQAEQIPSPGAAESVTLENIALMHTSFLRPDKTREYSGGRIGVFRNKRAHTRRNRRCRHGPGRGFRGR